MYNGTISGSFKNALDWLKLLADRKPPYLTDKVVGLISTAGGMQGLQAGTAQPRSARTTNSIVFTGHADCSSLEGIR